MGGPGFLPGNDYSRCRKAKRTVTWREFQADVRARGLEERFGSICREYGVHLQEVFEYVGTLHRRPSVKHARGRIVRYLMDVCKKSRREVADLFGVSWDSINQLMRSGYGLQDWEKNDKPVESPEPTAAE